MKKCKTRLKGNPTRLIFALFMLIALSAVALTSCNVTRVVTTKSEYTQRGDTTIMIQTKTTESYDATKKLN